MNAYEALVCGCIWQDAEMSISTVRACECIEYKCTTLDGPTEIQQNHLLLLFLFLPNKKTGGNSMRKALVWHGTPRRPRTLRGCAVYKRANLNRAIKKPISLNVIVIWWAPHDPGIGTERVKKNVPFASCPYICQVCVSILVWRCNFWCGAEESQAVKKKKKGLLFKVTLFLLCGNLLHF